MSHSERALISRCRNAVLAAERGLHFDNDFWNSDIELLLSKNVRAAYSLMDRMQSAARSKTRRGTRRRPRRYYGEV